MRYSSPLPPWVAAVVDSSKEKLTSTFPVSSFFVSPPGVPLEVVADGVDCWVPGFGCCGFCGALVGSTLLAPAAHPIPFESTYMEEISLSDESYNA